MPVITDFHTHNLEAPAGSIINPTLNEAEAFITLRPDATVSVGIHPWDTVDGQEDYSLLDRLALLHQVVAIGECGIDRLRGASPEWQERIFRHHVALSEKLAKPLTIHCVKAYDRILALKKELRPSQRWTIHGFRGNPTLARQLLDAGIDISIGKVHHPDIATVVPPGRLHHETD